MLAETEIEPHKIQYFDAMFKTHRRTVSEIYWNQTFYDQVQIWSQKKNLQISQCSIKKKQTKNHALESFLNRLHNN